MTKALQIKFEIPLESQYEAAEKIHRGEILSLDELADFLEIPRKQACMLYADKDFASMIRNVRMAASRFEFDRIAPARLQAIAESEDVKPMETIAAINSWRDLAYPNMKKSEVNVNITLESVMERVKSIDIEGRRFPGIDEE